VELTSVHANLRSASIAHEQQIKDMLTVREVVIDMSTTVDQADILGRIIEVVTDRLHFDRAMVLLRSRDSGVLTFGTGSHPPDDPSDQMRLSRLHLDVDAEDALNANDSLLGPWLRAKSLLIEDPAVYMESRLNWVLSLLKFNNFYSVPLVLGGDLLGVLLVDNLFTRRPITKEDRNVVDALATNIAITMENARLYDLQDEQLSKNLEEMRIMEQIDRDLADTLMLNNVLELLMDWALRFTNAGLSTVMLVDPAIETGRIAAFYGCTEDQLPGGRLATPLPLAQMGVSGRAALTGETQVVRDLSHDPDHLEILPNMVGQITVPITRQRRVVGVMSLETPNPDGFDAGHVTFLERLATRAGVALENARLFTESQQERGKMSAVIKQTTDAVVVVDYAEEILLLNLAALRVFRLDGEPEDYLGKTFNRVFGTTPLAVFYSALQYGESEESVSEIPIRDRTFHVGGTEVEGVGYSMILHDVTPFIEVDRLKNELVSSVSHDLKNPLSVMRGFVGLIEMTQDLNEKGHTYVDSIQRSIENMLGLIDNILDLAKVGIGIQLELEALNLAELVQESQQEMSLIAKEKHITFNNQFGDDVPPALGDRARVGQIIANLMSNALKYSLRAGEITVSAAAEDEQVRVSITDQGVGIAPVDLHSVWERWERVRNEQTKDIEGNGLGLAIVKSLVETHGGRVGVESVVDQGSTFWFTLPVADER
jgi:signal transduction histidine kinase